MSPLCKYAGNVSQTELFGAHNDSCIREHCDACFRPDLGQKLWGVSFLILDPTALMDGSFAPLASLGPQNFVYKLYRPNGTAPFTPDTLIGQTARDELALSDMHMQVIQLPGSVVSLSCGSSRQQPCYVVGHALGHNISKVESCEICKKCFTTDRLHGPQCAQHGKSMKTAHLVQMYHQNCLYSQQITLVAWTQQRQKCPNTNFGHSQPLFESFGLSNIASDCLR